MVEGGITDASDTTEESRAAVNCPVSAYTVYRNRAEVDSDHLNVGVKCDAVYGVQGPAFPAKAH